MVVVGGVVVVASSAALLSERQFEARIRSHNAQSTGRKIRIIGEIRQIINLAGKTIYYAPAWKRPHNRLLSDERLVAATSSSNAFGGTKLNLSSAGRSREVKDEEVFIRLLHLVFLLLLLLLLFMLFH